jgi:hypothetical protein
VREFFRSGGIDVVLHGHKHVNRMCWDHHYGQESDDESPLDASAGRPVLVISCGTVGSSVGDEMGRLVEISGHRDDRPRARVVRISSIRSVSAGARVVSRWRTTEVRLPQRPVHLPARSATLLQGRTASDVYAQLLERFEEIPTGARIEKLSCHVIDGASAIHLPQGYPTIHGHEDLDRWLQETVSWWQRPSSDLRSLRFTHGERIHRYAQTIDQLANCVTALRDDPTTGRAIVSFFDPRFDLVTDRSIKFPSFCSLQFVVDDARALDCVAYFRVQEMKYWWPVNMAEIASIQQTVVDRLWAERINLRPGSIFTVAAIALWEDTPPKVLVP